MYCFYRIFITLLFISIQCKALTQDSLFINNKAEFNNLIINEFLKEASALNQEIQNKIIKEFKRCKFSTKKYDCQYIFDFSIELDSCGKIFKVELLKPYSDKKLRKFGVRVTKIIKTSEFEILNNVQLIDTHFALTNSFLFTFEISCDPSEIIFFEEVKKTTRKKTILLMENDKVINVFNGFSTCKLTNE
jgi:hypothetical protein